ncbi:hypothetical protein [Rhodohalobacter barkolensis]|uniref:Yip1 domain-containing protein n=1 Tax=Rhodohalobacter barkolensis TaxID=2053187 RepID=A0A2N0VGS0_9BACT|nr:hypothetical protein [Rhodohalobacter barkolensis]PKD43363.1 hypothetical protein CWD77_12205 [Rhodohalobacter barkolensis]
MGGAKVFWIGFLIIIIHIPIGYIFNVRFDGAIDMHLVPSVESYLIPMLDVAIAWVSMFLCLYVSTLIFQSPIRLIDIAGATGVARIPLLISIIPGKIFEPNIQEVEDVLNLQGSELYLLIVGGFVVLLFFIWFMILLFNAYKVNSNLKGWRLWIGFILSVIIAEIISLVALAYI